jgi:diguanylate cyclase (GGDEF)-like protein
VASGLLTQLIGSQLSYWTSFGYVIFYPLIFVSIPALFEIAQESELVQLIDGAILVLGSSTIAAALLLRQLRADFLHVLYPICDLVLLIAVLIAFGRRPITGRSLLILLGFIVYSATDFIYLIMVSKGLYQINSHLNYGWLVGFTFITIGLFRRGIKSEKFPPIPIFYIAISVLSSSLTLVAISMNLFGLPNFIIGPALATLFASFIRMALALKQSERSFAEESLAKIDDLTGLPNRRRFISDIDKYRNGSILLMDLDGFKPVNDQFGHETGDEILKQVSSRFLKALPNGSLLARLGGDEFAVLTPADYEQAMELAMALRATLSYPFNIGGEQIRIDVSIGCVANDGRSDLMSRADTAMYQAKRAQVGVWASGI